MNTSRLAIGFLFLAAVPVCAQPEVKPANGLPYPLVSVEEAVRLAKRDRPIILHLHDVTLSDALTELSKQSGVRFGAFAGMNVQKTLSTQLSIDMETPNFKEAFRAIIGKADVKAKLSSFPGTKTLHVVFGQTPTEEEDPGAEEPPFNIRLQNITSSQTRMIVLGKTPRRSQNADLRVLLSAEVGSYMPVSGPGRLRVTRAVDDKGDSLRTLEPVPIFPGMDMGFGPAMSINLRQPGPDSRKLAKLEGVVGYLLPTKYENWDVADVLTAEGTSHEFKSKERTVRVAIKSALPGKDTLQLELEISSPAGGNLINGGNYSVLSASQMVSSLSLKDAKGHWLGSRGVSTKGTDDKVNVQLSFELPEEAAVLAFGAKDKQTDAAERPTLTGPISLAINVPVDFVQTEVPFSFSDIPLP